MRSLSDADLRRRIMAWRRRGAEARPSVGAVLEVLRTIVNELVAKRPGIIRERVDEGLHGMKRVPQT